MNIRDVATYCGEAANISTKQARAVIDTFVDLIAEELAEDGSCFMPLVGTLKYRLHDAYETKNPKTGERITVSARWKIHIKASKDFLRLVEKYRPKED